MGTDPQTRASFSRHRKWAIGLNVGLLIVIATAIVVMVNYLANQYFKRLYLSSLTRIELSPRTRSLLRSVTNEVDVTIYYDKEDPLYSNISDMLKEYHLQNRKIKVRTVDFLRDPGAAQESKMKYKLGSSTNRNFIVFDYGGHTRFVSGAALPDVKYDPVPGQAQPTFDRKLIAFNGEMYFTAALFAVLNPKPAKACFLEGHGEASIEDADSPEAFHGFAEMLRQNYIVPESLSLFGTNTVPSDCDLLVIAAPQKEIPTNHLEKIEQYLEQGGRMFVLFNFHTAAKRLGLERLLAEHWGVDVGHNAIKEPASLSPKGVDMIVYKMGVHRVTKSLIEARTPLHMVLPRRVSRIEPPAKSAIEVPQVTELVYSSQDSIASDNAVPRSYPLAVAVEKNLPKSGTTERGPTRMVIFGEYFLFDNQLIEESASANRDFAESSVNWLLERPVLLEGVGPRKVNEYRLLLSQGQLRAVQWALLAVLPGAILFFGGLVWLRRRK